MLWRLVKIVFIDFKINHITVCMEQEHLQGAPTIGVLVAKVSLIHNYCGVVELVDCQGFH